MLANYSSPQIWAACVLLVALLGFNEFEKLCAHRNLKPLGIVTRLSIALFLLTPIIVLSQPISVFLIQAVIIALSFLLMLIAAFLTGRSSFEDISVSLWGALYLGFLPSYLIWIRELESGADLITLIIFTVGLNDVVAMYTGRAIGKIPLSPSISPNKTVEGSLAGLLTAALNFCLMFFAFGFKFKGPLLWLETQNIIINILFLLFIGLFFGLIAQIGDLLESLFKRGAGVKNSGSIFFSHGGVLDRTDSHFAVACLAYIFFVFCLE